MFEIKSQYDKDKIKESLTIEQVANIVSYLQGDPQVFDDYLISKTICHNEIGEESSYKLYYYDNTKLFHCYTSCGSFDIFELVCKVKNINNDTKKYMYHGEEKTREWELHDAIVFIVNFFNLSAEAFNQEVQTLPDWKYFNKHKDKDKKEFKNLELKPIDDKILARLPHPHIASWEAEGITYNVCEARGIAYDPANHGIIIPHYDINGSLVGIRTRTLVKENEIYGKYRPAYIGGKLYNHPLGYNLYNLNCSKDNIKKMKKVIVWEGEKSCLLFASYFGLENDITCATCGSNLTKYHFQLLKDLGVEEIIIGYDKQYHQKEDLEAQEWIKKLCNIYDKFGKDVKFSFLFDKENLLEYKMSPIDNGPDIFMELFKKRVII